MGLMLGLGRSPGGGHGNPLQYSCLENPMDRGTWWATSIGSQSVGQDLIFRSPFHLKPLIYRDGFPGSQNEFRGPQLGIWLPYGLLFTSLTPSYSENGQRIPDNVQTSAISLLMTANRAPIFCAHLCSCIFLRTSAFSDPVLKSVFP